MLQNTVSTRCRTVLSVLLAMSVAVSVLHQSAWAQPFSDPLVIPELSGSIELDGRLDEVAWDEARRLVAVQHRPSFGEDPSERTKAGADVSLRSINRNDN